MSIKNTKDHSVHSYVLIPCVINSEVGWHNIEQLGINSIILTILICLFSPLLNLIATPILWLRQFSSVSIYFSFSFICLHVYDDANIWKQYLENNELICFIIMLLPHKWNLLRFFFFTSNAPFLAYFNTRMATWEIFFFFPPRMLGAR